MSRKIHTILFISLWVFTSVSFAANPVYSIAPISPKEPVWVDIGLGLIVGDGLYAGLGIQGSGTVAHTSGLYTLRFLYSESVIIESGPILPGEQREVSPKSVSSLDGYYGWIWKKKYGYLSGSLGVSLIRKQFHEYTEPPVRKTRYLPGFPLMGQLFITPVPFVGIGVIGNYVFTSESDLVSLQLCLEIGRLR